MDVILSSGYLAFARQIGFLTAIEREELPVEALCGTSSGALVGAMWAAGLSAATIGKELRAMRPIDILQPKYAFWQGLFSLDGIVKKLRDLGVPERFDQLPRPFAVGVVTLDGRHQLLSEGPLPDAVAASCAIPYLFAPRQIEGRWWADGGVVDRTGIAAFRAWRGGDKPTVVHLVKRSRGGMSGDLTGLSVVHTGSSRAGLWGLGPFESEFEEALAAATPVISGLRKPNPGV